MKAAAVNRAWLCFAIVVGYTSGLCAQTDAGTDVDVEVTADGLHRVDPSIMRSAWAKPDLNLRPYKKVLPWRAAVSFRPVEDRSARARRRGQATYPIDEDSQLRIATLFQEAFQANLADLEDYELWGGPGRDVLMVEAYLLDVVTHVPLEQSIVDDVSGDSTWEATLLLQIRDSMSDEILARAAGRYRERGGSDAAAGGWIHTQQVIRRWSEILRERLDELSDFGYQR